MCTYHWIQHSKASLQTTALTLPMSPSCQVSRRPGSRSDHLQYTISILNDSERSNEHVLVQDLQSFTCRCYTFWFHTSIDPFALATASLGFVTSSQKRRHRMADGTTSKKRTRHTSIAYGSADRPRAYPTERIKVKGGRRPAPHPVHKSVSSLTNV